MSARFWAKVDMNAPIPEYAPELGNCWVWTAAKVQGYGRFGIAGTRRCMLAHHYLKGTPPAGLVSDHLCRNPSCVRPSHIEFVTNRENIRRGVRGRMVTHCAQGHAFDETNTMIVQGRRRCRACKKERDSRRATSAKL